MRDRVATAASLRPFFQPQSAAVLGASRDPASIGYSILEALMLNCFQGPCLCMAAGNFAAQSVHHLGIDLAACEAALQRGRFGQAHHLDRPFDDLPLAAKRSRHALCSAKVRFQSSSGVG